MLYDKWLDWGPVLYVVCVLKLNCQFEFIGKVNELSLVTQHEGNWLKYISNLQVIYRNLFSLTQNAHVWVRSGSLWISREMW